VRLTKNDFSSVFGSVLQKTVVFSLVSDLQNLPRFRFVHSFFCTVYMHSTDVLRCWIIGPTNCQPKWLRTRSAETQHEEKYFDCWSYHAAKCLVNETTWKTVPKLPKSVFWKRTVETEFSGFFLCRFSSIFRKPMSDIFIGFHTPLLSRWVSKLSKHLFQVTTVV